MFDDYLFVMPSVIRGVGRVIDITGSYGNDSYVFADSATEADKAATAGDWRRTGSDLAAAMDSGDTTKAK